MFHFETKGAPFVYLLLKKGTRTYLGTVQLAGRMNESPKEEVQSYHLLFASVRNI